MSRTAVLLAFLLPFNAAAQTEAPDASEAEPERSEATDAASEEVPEPEPLSPEERGEVPETDADSGDLSPVGPSPVGPSPFAPLAPEAKPKAKAPEPAAKPQEAPAKEPEVAAASAPSVPTAMGPPTVYGDPDTRFSLRLDGYLRTELACIYPSSFCGIGTPADQDAGRNPYVGRSDWFALGGARVNLRGRYGEDLYVRLSLAGEAVRYDDSVNPAGRYEAQMQDAYLSYRLSNALKVHLGRFRPPYDVESLTPLEGLLFVHRSLESRGVLPQEGWAGDEYGNFSPGRQLGAMVSGEHALGGDDVRLGYHVAVTNGSSGLTSLNDNDRAAVYGRVTFELRDSDRYADYHRRDEEGPATVWLEDGLRIGLGGFYNDLTFGEPPNRLNDRVLGAGLDVSSKYSYFIFQGQILFRQVQHLTRGGSADERGLGGHVQLSFDVLGTGFYPGYRFSFLDPREAIAEVTPIETADSNQVMHHTVGIKWISKSLPLMGFFEYTVALEEEGRELPNDRIEAALQVIFE